MAGCFWSASKGDPINIGVPCQWDGAIFRVASDDRDHTGRKARLFDQARELQHWCGGNFRGFEHHSTARR